MFYIYLDTKILGAAKQTISMFRNGIFSTQEVSVLVRKYRHSSTRIICNLFKRNGISFRLVRYADLDNLNDGIVFYPFNAQSNTRFVANRKLKHIFITHGESNKISSTKPIIRIYDHVITAGEAGIKRYLDTRIFNQYDLLYKRIIMMGDTFVGRTGLSASNEKKQKVLFYAPTWEGGIESENYSSLEYPDFVVQQLLKACSLYNVNTILIKPHPNTGHRKKGFFYSFISSLYKVKDRNITVLLYQGDINLSYMDKYRLKRKGIIFIGDLSLYFPTIAFCDVSAIETQLLNENILHYIFYRKQDEKIIDNQVDPEFYREHSIILNNTNYNIKKLGSNYALYLEKIKNRLIYSDVSEIPIESRISYLKKIVSGYN